MGVDFVPSAAVAAALAACGLVPAFLIALSHGVLKVVAPGRRFVLAAALAWVAWLATVPVTAPDAVDLVTSVLLLATATLAGFTLWTLVAWGFTVSMLLALDRAAAPLTVDEWALAYTRGKPIDAFARDRLGVLFKLKLAETRGDVVVMTPVRGRLFALAAGTLRTLFGLSK
ncbi:Uncharacterized protein OS=Crocosphaera watsonii WH 8501 GN=CwatDRAFT_1333 PE=4 SV=1 [Gemmataceae bacterium]|nr:Uncharacterized protein OS=Crocosphaera watsonii WH 8501 GN=CwatDRAFT_1333 PE=4 SV=1 [Gemmataceae bacterium]VTT97521.1 Uncharacterized protein OS=Crocosphaera watsonii WH 8501 GN=CwatDRAFT_1333 PE=4 SV=1 [Gemmataceae bacterium]